MHPVQTNGIVRIRKRTANSLFMHNEMTIHLSSPDDRMVANGPQSSAVARATAALWLASLSRCERPYLGDEGTSC
ncbi:predicted protein [Plenodomus lingam JN3]|uniref:Predicted protein n=1 Tax=Leptosphaeria maculans (strain JN3 / isolate v23.1.3 / race Av1-4-5-6-7-8) TaxID=985895 RepID=E5A9K1_LEPMJ|nr:predicted protein [Plenodomus lingam JN3]CBY00342.1 predicted protein [Plenodomus lingam JN3]